MKITHNTNNRWEDEAKGILDEDLYEWVRLVIEDEKQKMLKKCLDPYEINCEEDIWQSARFEGAVCYEIVQKFYKLII